MVAEEAARHTAVHEKSKSRKAIVVAHGIGQQRPFEVLDSFAQGLVRIFNDPGKTGKPDTSIRHLKLPRGEEFDHCIRLETLDLILDVYEYYWAPLTEGNASFSAVISWLAITAFTPLQRLAYNIPLILTRSKTTLGACYQLLRELWRIVYIPLIVLTIIGLAGYLVTSVASFLKSLFTLLGPAVSVVLSADLGQFAGNAVTILVFLGMLLVLTSLLISVPAQIRDMFRLRNVLRTHKRNPFSNFASAFMETAEHGDKWIKRARRAARATGAEEERWSIEIRTRRWLSIITALGILFLTFITYLIVSGHESQFLLTRPLTPVVHTLIQSLNTHKTAPNGPSDLQRLGIILTLLAVGTLLKRVFIDYVGDVALYATADENSAFFKTRMEILTEATRKLRWVLRAYNDVSAAGHSLGSVIMYDAISWLRVESQVSFHNGEPVTPATASTAPLSEEEFVRLRALITFGSPLDKIFYFFRTKVRAYETIRAHILNELHAFRMFPALAATDPRIQDFPPFKPPDGMKWLNVYSSADPISGRLAYFENVDNYWRWYWLWGLAHLSYWHDNNFYRRVLHTIAPADGIGQSTYQ